MVRGFFYSDLFPLWEGYDEYAHFAFIQYLSNSQGLPTPQQSELSKEIHDSLQLVPLPWELRDLPPPSLTHDAYWRLPESVRQSREAQFAALSPELAHQAEKGELFWEAQQPPLYYILLAGPLRLLGRMRLAGRVLCMRYLSVAITSLVIPLGFRLGALILEDEQLALGVIALIAAMPELMIDVSRVGNDSLSIPLYTLLVFLTAKLLKEPGNAGYAWASGLVLGCGLLTKEYFVTCLPVLALAFAWMYWRAKEQRRKIVFHGLVLGALATIIAGWWIVRNYLSTGMWLWQPGADAARKVPILTTLRSAPEVDWRNVVRDVFTSHIWFGNWSFLHVRGWMYTVIWYGAMIAAIGLVIYAWRAWRGPAAREGGVVPAPVPTAMLILYYGFFCLGLAYHAVLTFLLFNASTSIGWYLYCAVVVEVLLVMIGLVAIFGEFGRRWMPPALTALFVTLELYGTHFLLIPYYSGLIAHRADGALETFHVSMVNSIGLLPLVRRLVVNKPSELNPPLFLIQWILFIFATLGLVFVSAYVSRDRGAATDASVREIPPVVKVP